MRKGIIGLSTLCAILMICINCISLLFLFASAIFADDSDSVESAFGPPSTPNITISKEEYQSRLKLLPKNETNADFLYELAYLAFYMDELDISEKYFLKSAEIGNYKIPFYGSEYYLNHWLGQIYEKRGELTKARQYYEQADDIYYIHLIKAKIFIESKNYDQAEAEYLKALRVELFELCNYEEYLTLINMFVEIENFEKAEYYAEIYIKKMRALEAIQDELMYTYDFETEIAEAEKLLEEIKAKRK
ncbi:MAG: hypothetical protein V3V99_04875 [candidate division Zixibacteria bacterium]